MTCSQCGTEAPKKAAFCPNCGAQLNEKTGAARMHAAGGKGGSNVAEQELWTGAYCPKAMIGTFVGAGLLTIVAMIAASFAPPIGWTVVIIGAVILFCYLGLLLLYRRLSKSYRLTSQRLLRDTGILSRTGDHLLVVNIDDVTVHQGIFDRMLNVGTIALITMDKSTKIESEGRFTMSGIENPRRVADLIDEVRRNERNRRALYTVDA